MKPKPIGRPLEFAVKLSVRLTLAQAAIARQLGDGDASAGIRAALEMAAKNKSEKK